MPPRSVVVVTGIMGAGKSTVAELLARRLPMSVHVRGDWFRRAIVRGRAEMTPDAGDEAIRQLHLRYELAAMVADRYAAAGFTAVYQDIVVGDQLPATVERIRSRPLYVVALAPSADVAGRRAEDRDKVSGYGDWTPDTLDALLRATPRIGLWLDTSDQSAIETVDEIMRRAEEARID
jgi:predicted kinase